MKSKTPTRPTERGTIYPPGYTKPGAATSLERLMRQPNMRLVDVRSQPMFQRYPQWNRASLADRYGAHYVWERRFGTLHSRSRALAIQLPAVHQDAIREAATLRYAGTSLVLLCACHRSDAAKLIQDGLPVPTALREVGT
jgi:Protein of unknown function, DUF488